MKNNTLSEFIWSELTALQNFQRKNIEMFESSDEKYANISADNEDIYDKELLAVEQAGGN